MRVFKKKVFSLKYCWCGLRKTLVSSTPLTFKRKIFLVKNLVLIIIPTSDKSQIKVCIDAEICI